MQELPFFLCQFEHMCNKKVKNLEDSKFTHFILDKEKREALKEWPQVVRSREYKQKRKQLRLKQKAMKREDYSSAAEIHDAAED